MSVYNFLAWTSPGLQRTLLEELRSLHFSARPTKIGIYPTSAVFFDSTIEQLHQLLYKPTVLTYLNLRINKPIQARNPKEFLKNFSSIQLHPYIPINAEIDLRLSVKSCYFNHSVGWKDCILEAIHSQSRQHKMILDRKELLDYELGSSQNTNNNNNNNNNNNTQLQLIENVAPKFLVNAYLYQNYATLYVQLHKDSLHKHGIKKQIGKASLAENVATALLHYGQLDNKEDCIIWDPFCGSGTILLCALSKLNNINIREDSYETLKAMPIYKEYQMKCEEQTQIKLFGSDKDFDQIKQFYMNLQNIPILEKVANTYPPQLNCKTYKNIDIIQMDYQAVYQNYLQGKKLIIISNPPWNQRIQMPYFDRMIRFLKGVSQECYLLISNEQYKEHDWSDWEVLAEPLVGGKWTKIVRFSKTKDIVRSDSKSDLEVKALSYTKHVSEYQNEKTIALEKNIQMLSKKINNYDYIVFLRGETRTAAEKYGQRLKRLQIGKKTKIRQLILKRSKTLLKARIRKLNLQLQQMRTFIKGEQVEMKKQEVKNKLLYDKFGLDQLNQESVKQLQNKLDKVAKVKSLQLIKKSRRISIPKW